MTYMTQISFWHWLLVFLCNSHLVSLLLQIVQLPATCMPQCGKLLTCEQDLKYWEKEVVNLNTFHCWVYKCYIGAWLVFIYYMYYHNLPINKGAPYSLEGTSLIINDKNRHSFFNNCPIFNPKLPLESLEPQLCPQATSIRCDLARAPGVLIRQNMVSWFNPTWNIPISVAYWHSHFCKQKLSTSPVVRSEQSIYPYNCSMICNHRTKFANIKIDQCYFNLGYLQQYTR